MKKLIVILILIVTVSAVSAQKGKVASALSFKDMGKLDKALETIEITVDPNNAKAAKSIAWPRTWEVRGEIYQAIYQSKDENIKKLVKDPLTEALKSYKKALELDTKHRYDKSIKIKLTLLTTDFTNQAVEAFSSQDYNLALQTFEQILELEEVPIIKADNPDIIDTVILFNAGLAAYNAENYDKAIKYYKEAAKYGYNGARTHLLISNAYELMKDTLNSLEALKEGFLKYPEDNGIIVKMINIYLNSDRPNDAMEYLKLAIEKDPGNASFYFAKGSLYDQLGNQEEAIIAYKKAIELKDDDFNSYYNLGALYYNKGVKQIEVANAVPTNQPEKYEEEKAKADVWFNKALPYMEKCYELNDKDLSTLESLKNLYYRMKNMDKYKEIDDKIKNL
ncbi:hypothetical protein MNBD_BACTEROID01-1258 [hydrothermal vent metagenome]|uniref:Uncharacterized protein n=1 Tax=hydrothermal vent metagenome TaxID=652676 RepID=A0A3B0T957_9ZZZZ